MNLETALVHEICPICCAKTNEQIVLNHKLTEKAAAQVKDMHGKAIGFSEPCEKCQEYIAKDFVAIVGIDPSKSNPVNDKVALGNIWRTGQLIWLKKSVAKDIFNWDRPEPFILAEDEVVHLLIQKAENVEQSK